MRKLSIKQQIRSNRVELGQPKSTKEVSSAHEVIWREIGQLGSLKPTQVNLKSQTIQPTRLLGRSPPFVFIKMTNSLNYQKLNSMSSILLIKTFGCAMLRILNPSDLIRAYHIIPCSLRSEINHMIKKTSRNKIRDEFEISLQFFPLSSLGRPHSLTITFSKIFEKKKKRSQITFFVSISSLGVFFALLNSALVGPILVPMTLALHATSLSGESSSRSYFLYCPPVILIKCKSSSSHSNSKWLSYDLV